MGETLTAARNAAFLLYCQGQPQKSIAHELGVSEKSICNWKQQGQWKALRGDTPLPADTPLWVYRLLTLLVEQQTELQTVSARLVALETLLRFKK